MKKISVIIVTFNSTDLIIDCIDSIYKFNDIDLELLEIIVVDNSSQAESEKILKLINQVYGPKIKFINNRFNLGYGYGNNIGIKTSIGDILCVMNPDVRLTEPLFSNVIKHFEKKKKLGILGYKQKGGKNISFYVKPEYFLPIINSLIIRVTNKLNIFFSKYLYLSGALLFIDKAKFYEVGLFDENIFLYFEEPFISNKMLSKNYQIIFNKNYQYLHLIGNREIWSENTFTNWLSSVNYYLKNTNINPKKYLYKKIIEFKLQLLIFKMFFNLDKFIKIRNQYKFLKQEYFKNKY